MSQVQLRYESPVPGVRKIGLLAAVAAVLVGTATTAFDAAFRFEWPAEGVTRFILGLWVLRVVEILGVVGGFIYGAGLARALDRALGQRTSQQKDRHFDLALLALAVLLFFHPAAFSTFSGRLAQALPLAGGLPYALLSALLLVAVVWGWCLKHVLQSQRAAYRWIFGSASFCLGATGLYVDCTYLVSLYGSLHELLEWASQALLWGAALIPLGALARRRTVKDSSRAWDQWHALFFAPALLAFFPHMIPIGPEGARILIREPGLAGRSLQRMTFLADFVKAPFSTARAPITLRERIVARFDLSAIRLHPKWQLLPQPAPRPGQAKTMKNVVVFYVDTLRADVATDPLVMPRSARFFARESLSFSHAYSSGSETSQSLPNMLSGTYAYGKQQSATILEGAAAAGLRRVHVVPLSAQTFFAEMAPQFQFDQEVRVDDQPSDEPRLLGYGGKSVAQRLTTEALRLLKSPENTGSLVWISQFDVHNWQLIDENELATDVPQRKENGRALSPKYLRAAAGVDAAFARLIEGLSESGLIESTVILFASDHGEALGYRGILTHSLFVWEPMVRVPLAIAGPGIPHQVVKTAVSTVDVAPTLLGYWGQPPQAPMHGENLLMLAQGAERRSPPLLIGTRGRRPYYLGIVDKRMKLILSLDHLESTLYDLTSDPLEKRDATREASGTAERLLEELLSSPALPN